MRTSRFVNLSSYCVVEYMFDQLGSLDFYTDDFILLENPVTDIHQIFNDDASYNNTKNIRDLTAVPIGNNLYAYLDSEKVPNYLVYDTNFTQTTLSGYNVVMDQVRFHFVAGFDFDNFEALLLSIKHLENDGKSHLFANILLAPETSAEMISFNPKPLFLGNALYDRYIDILVPSIKNINEEYRTAPVKSTTFEAQITPAANGYKGFIYNNPLYIGLAECGKRKPIYTNIGVTYDAFEVTDYFEAALSQSNEFDLVGAYINEAVNGDYIEFYMTYNSGFPEELISTLNLRNPADDWIIIHQLSVFEQVGSSFINTSRFSFFQEEKYDEPNVFRPVLRNANEAVSMSIDYLARLINRRNGEQVIRESSFSLISPKKYGRKLTTIPLLDKPQSQRIYNKIIKKDFEATKLFIDPPLANSFNNLVGSSTTTSTSTTTVTQYVPIFFNSNNISISNVSSLVKTSDSNDEVVFGPGKLRFVLSPFDNVIKLKVYTSNSTSNSTKLVPLDLNINSAKYQLVFETSSGQIAVNNSGDANLENLSTGTLVFNVAKKDAKSILASTIKTVSLVSVSQDLKQTLIYSGEWRKATEQADVDTAIAEALESSKKNQLVQDTLNQISAQTTANTKSTDISTSIKEAATRTKTEALVPTVNKFGVSFAKGIQATSSNL